MSARSIASAKFAAALAPLVILGSGLFAWRTQYYVDYEVSLLPWLVSRGWSLYTDMFDQHPPLLTWLLSLTGGDPGWPLQAMIVGLHVLTLALTYRLAAQLAGRWAGLASAALASIWLHSFETTHLWFDAALAPLYLLAAELAIRDDRVGVVNASGREEVVQRRTAGDLPAGWMLLAAGVLLGAAVLVKQHALVAVVALAVWLAWPGRTAGMRRLAIFTMGLLLPLLITAGLLLLRGTLGDAWYWLVQFNLESNYASSAALYPSLEELPVLAALFACAVALLFAVWLGALKAREAVLLLLFLAAAALPAWPRYGRFHLAGAVPLLAVAGGTAAVALWSLYRQQEAARRLARTLGLSLIALSALVGVWQAWQVLISWGQLGGPQPPYAATLSPLHVWVSSNTTHDDPIFINELDAVLYRLLEREPPRPFVPQLPWVLATRDLRAQMWRGVERASPKVLLTAAEWWDGNSPTRRAEISWPEIARYREAARFTLVSYPGARPVELVGLLRE